ncbi:MAG: DUF551 domain-containing protein [Lentisphaeria bacterium]|nr:DUF551 domain-containing protein [Lentisphaeria bacterium]
MRLIDVDAPTYDAPAWVPIEEQMPGPDDIVLMYSAKNKDMLYGYIEENWDGYTKTYVAYNGNERMPDVSHWMAQCLRPAEPYEKTMKGVRE